MLGSVWLIWLTLWKSEKRGKESAERGEQKERTVAHFMILARENKFTPHARLRSSADRTAPWRAFLPSRKHGRRRLRLGPIAARIPFIPTSIPIGSSSPAAIPVCICRGISLGRAISRRLPVRRQRRKVTL